MTVAESVKQRALEIGFDLAGIAPLSAWADLEFSRQWVERGYGGEMRYLANPRRHDPRRVLPSAKSVVCVGLVYNAPLPYSTAVRSQEPEDGRAGRARVSSFDFPVSAGRDPDEAQSRGPLVPTGWISRYAWGTDYHDLIRAKLQRLRGEIETLAPGVETRVYTDTGPIVERAFARLSGIGWMGKNTCLINQEKGSWFFLGVILTSLELAPDLPAPDRCGSCTRCIEACPTGALVEPYVMDASRCIAYFTIELKGSIPAEFRPAIGANVFGCDICQDVCPWNSKDRSQESEVRSQNEEISHPPSALSAQSRKAATTELREFQPLQITPQPVPRECSAPAPSPQPPAPVFSLFNPPLESLASLTEDDFRRIFAHSPIKRAKYRGWLRNLCVAMGNSGDARFVPWLEKAREHPDAKVREHADWAMGRLTRP